MTSLRLVKLDRERVWMKQTLGLFWVDDFCCCSCVMELHVQTNYLEIRKENIFFRARCFSNPLLVMNVHLYKSKAKKMDYWIFS